MNPNQQSKDSTPKRRLSKIEELREKLEAKTNQKNKKQKPSKNSRSSFHDNIYKKQDREKVMKLIKESQIKKNPRKKKKKISTKQNGEKKGLKDKKGNASSKKILGSTRNIKSKKVKKTQSKRVIKNSYLKKGGRDKISVGVKAAKKITGNFKKKNKIEELTEFEVPDFSRIGKGAKSTSPRGKKKMFKKGGKLSRMSSPKRKKKVVKESGKKKKKEEVGGVDELNDLISESKELHIELKKSITKDNLHKNPIKSIKKSKSTISIKRTKSRTPKKKTLKNSSTIKNLKGRGVSKRVLKAKRRKSKSATRKGFGTQKKGVDEVVFATEKKFMRMKSARRIRPKEEYESGIPLRQKGKAKLKIKKKKKKIKKSKKKKQESDTNNLSFDGQYESGFISEIQTRAIIPNQTPNSKIVYNIEKKEDFPKTTKTVKKEKKTNLVRTKSESDENYLKSLVLEESNNYQRESVSYKYFQTDGKFSDNDEQAELKNSLFADHYQRNKDNDDNLLSSKFINSPMDQEYNADKIFNEITNKNSEEEINKTLEKFQSLNETHEKEAENDIYKFIDSKKQSSIEFNIENKKNNESKLKLISQTNIDFEGLIQQKSKINSQENKDFNYSDKAKSSLNKIFNKAMNSKKIINSHKDIFKNDIQPIKENYNITFSFNEIAKERVRVISFKALEKAMVSSKKKSISPPEHGPIGKEYTINTLSSRFINSVSNKAIKSFNKKVENKSLNSLGLKFSGGKVTNQFNNFRGRSSIAMPQFNIGKKSLKINTLTSIEEKNTSKPLSMKDFVKLNTKKMINRVMSNSKQNLQNSNQIAKNMKITKKNENKNNFVIPEINVEFKKLNFVKTYMKHFEKKIMAKMEFNKIDEDMDLIKSKIEITENNIANDLMFFQEILDKDNKKNIEETDNLFKSKVDVHKYFSKDESIILEEQEEEYITYEHSGDSMSDLRSIDFSKKETFESELNDNKDFNSKEKKKEEKDKKKNFDFGIEVTNSVFIGRNSQLNKDDNKKIEKKVEKKKENKKVIIKNKKLETIEENKQTKKLKKNKEVKKKNLKVDKIIKSVNTISKQKKNIRESIRDSKMFKINSVTDYGMNEISSSESESESENSDWEKDFEKDKDYEESNRSSKQSRLDSDYFLHKKGDTNLLRILHESQRVLKVIQTEEQEGKKKINESEFEKFQKSQKIYFKPSDLKGLSEHEEDIRNRIKTSNRLIMHINQNKPDLQELSSKDITEMKILIEEPFKYKSFDKLTENEKKERIDLEMTYKEKMMIKINNIITKNSGKRQSHLIQKEIKNVVSGRTLHRWNNISNMELKAICKIQRFFRFKIEEKIGKKIMEMQKKYYQTRASIINPPK